MRIFLLSLTLWIAASVAFADDREGSPLLYRVAKGAVIEITEPFYAGSKTVTFKKGQKIGWFSVGQIDPKCQIEFNKTPNAEVKDGRYRVIKTGTNRFATGESEFTLTTTLFLQTISGPSAYSIECVKSGFYNETDETPITVQSFKHTVGNYLDIKFDSE
jgi:hypothetical protein